MTPADLVVAGNRGQTHYAASKGINSLQQGGLPVDVAETIAWLSQPGSAGVNGQ
ncbi:hypothetical protein SAMN04488085_1276, partial [Geodermatophilus ruber]